MMTVRLSEDERAWLEALAVDEGLSASDILRTLLRRAYRDRFGDVAKPKARKKTRRGDA